MQPMRGGPRRAGIWIGVILMVIGVVGGLTLVLLGAKSLNDTVNGFQRIDLRQGGTVSFTKIGRYDAYFERPGVRRRRDIPPIRVLLSGPGGGLTLNSDIGRSNTTEHYSFGHHEGVRLTKFNVTTVGRYRVSVAVAGEPTTGLPGQLAFGKGSIAPGLIGIAGGVLGGGFIALIGFVTLIATLVRRGRYRRRMAQGAFGAPYGGGYPAGPTWPPSGPGSPAGPWPPGDQTGPPPPAPSSDPSTPPPGWAPPPGPPPGAARPAWPPASPPGPGPTSDPDRPGWGGRGQ